ncbi:MAG: MerR family transcriptional regulator [Gemmatimonadales bacterium]
MQVGELAERTGVSVRSIRYYEQAGLLRATRRANGYRDFGDPAVERVRAVRDLLETGFTVDEVLSLAGCLQAAAPGTHCGVRTAQLYGRKLAKVDGQLRTLRQLRDRIKERITRLQGAANG